MSRKWLIALLVLLLLFVTSVRLRLAPCPLERDEGEYAYLGQLILQGIAPYKEAANMKFPGTYACYAVIEYVFGQTPAGIHRGLLLVNLASIVLIYYIGTRFSSDTQMALMSASIFGIASLSFSFLGPMAHATHFVVFFGLFGLALLFSAIGRDSIWLYGAAGAITGLAYMAKQSGFYFVAYGCVTIICAHGWQAFCRPCLRASCYFLAGAFAPFAVTVYVLQKAGALDTFVFWTFRYASSYGPPLETVPKVLRACATLMTGFGLGWIFLVTAILGLFSKVTNHKDFARGKSPASLPVFFAFSLAGVSLGLYFRQHYWIQLLPPTAFLSAQFLLFLSSKVCRREYYRTAAGFACITMCVMVALAESKRFFADPPDTVIRQVYPGSLFLEARNISDYIKQHSRTTDRIFVFGSEPEIYFYSDRHSPSTNLYLYNLIEQQPYAFQMQKALVSELELSPPRYIIEAHQAYFNDPDGENKHQLFRWKNHFLDSHYKALFIYERVNSATRYLPAAELLQAPIGSPNFMLLWEKVL